MGIKTVSVDCDILIVGVEWLVLEPHLNRDIGVRI